MSCHSIQQFTKPDQKISSTAPASSRIFAVALISLRPGKIKAFKLLNIAGAYWLGDEEESATAAHLWDFVFLAEKDLDAHLQQVEEAKKRDHRVLGQQLYLFSI